MNWSNIITVSLMSVFAVACSHTRIQEDTTKSIQEVSPKFVKEEVKSENLNKEVKSNQDLSLSCSQGKDSRTITIQKGDNRCEVHYTKDGQLNNIAWGEKTPSICRDVFENVRGNLEKGNFKCVSLDTTAAL